MAAPAGMSLLAACLLVVALGGGVAEAQGGGVGQCVPQLNRLLACRAYLVPGAPDPSADCCGALSAVSHECACSTMGIISSLPGRCSLAPVNCSA
ncbi:anther-specific protein MZm3-3-like [Panicum miliaceum]|uniref:Anther-specific protein MZm3-3-like n=1 Tax=Panicum miliaceum TaxID=4540 RepID=A0A3L6RG13_PANMI|nr:anther-specific protein MZm3-3-like [Panicum miliaceum]